MSFQTQINHYWLIRIAVIHFYDIWGLSIRDGNLWLVQIAPHKISPKTFPKMLKWKLQRVSFDWAIFANEKVLTAEFGK